MAIDNKLLAEIKNKVQPGKHVKYMDKNNLLDAKTVNDPDNTLEKAIKAMRDSLKKTEKDNPYLLLFDAIRTESKSLQVVE